MITHPTKTNQDIMTTATTHSKQNKLADVICIGEILIEFVGQQTNVSLPEVSTFLCAPGGAPANVAVGVQRLCSFQAAFIGKVGSDCFGVELRRTLEREHVDTSSLLVDPIEKTTLVFDSVWDDGHKELCFYRGADSCLRPGETSLGNIFDSAKCFHFGSITLIKEPGASAQRELLSKAKEKGLMVTYDPNYRPTLWPDEATAKRTILTGYHYANVAKISEEEWKVATGCDDLEEGIQAVLGRGVELLIVTRGENGAMATTGEFTVESQALENISVVETTGAGDAFMAAMITRLLPEFQRLGGSLRKIDKRLLQEALDYANVVAGLTCTATGAIPALPKKGAVDDYIRAQHEEAPIHEMPRKTYPSQQLAQMIDHTFLKPYGKPEDIEKLCQEACKYQFAMVAVNPSEVKRCAYLLDRTNVRVGAAIGFPLGQNTTKVKVYETLEAIQNGATEIDMVLNVRELQNGNIDYVRNEIEQVVQICREKRNVGTDKHITCKVILETCYLTDPQKIQACKICCEAGVDFVKTSTGFGPAGATVKDVELMRRTVAGSNVGVKASGGIRSLDCAIEMIDAGATRIGTSNGVAIMYENEQRHQSIQI